jgi:hypothetical protein
MQDEERGILGFCTASWDNEESEGMSGKGSGCATVSVSHISDNTINVKAEKWFYRNEHEEISILPQDFTIMLDSYRKPIYDGNEDHSDPLYEITPVPGYQNSSYSALAGVSDSGDRYHFAKITEEEGTFPAWYHQYDGLNDYLEGVFGFGEIGGDNVNTSNVFVFPLSNGSFRLRYFYTEFGYPVIGNNGELGIPEYSIDHGVGDLSRMSTEYWVCIWYPGKDTKVTVASERFKSFYKDRYIPDLMRVAQAKDWEDGFESIPQQNWPEERYWDYKEVVMCKKLIFAAQEVIAGRFDGDMQKLSDFVENRYKPSAVKLEHYYPENDPDAYILHFDLDADGEEEILAIRAYRRDGKTKLPVDSIQLMINREVYFNLYGETVQVKIFAVDIDKSDNLTEFAFVFTQEDGYSTTRLFRYDNGCVLELGSIWGKLDNEFSGTGRIAEFPGDGSIVNYVPDNGDFVREVIYPEDEHGMWIGSTYFY